MLMAEYWPGKELRNSSDTKQYKADRVDMKREWVFMFDQYSHINMINRL